MVNTSDMIISSLAKVWHLIPIVIAIILFKKFINKKDKKRNINMNKEKEKNGLTMESRIRLKYEELGYKVTSLDEKNLGINFFCYKESKSLLVKYNINYKSKSVSEEDITIFHNNSIKYIKDNHIKENNVEFRYVILYSDILDKTAIKILSNDSYNCKYTVLSN